MKIERTRPMKMHKNLVILCLQKHPEDLANIAPGFEGTAEQYIALLEAHPGVWFYGGELLTEEECKAKDEKYRRGEL